MSPTPTQAPHCTSCGRDLRPHCKHCTWWRCTNRVCGIDLHDFTRGVRTLTNGGRERIPTGPATP